MRFILVLCLLISTTVIATAQSISSNKQSTSSNDIPVVFDPMLQSYDYLMNLPVNKVNKSEYVLGFGDVISVVFRGDVSLVLKSQVITSSEDIYIPKLGFVSLRGKTISEAESEIKKLINQQFQFIQVEISLEIARKIDVSLVQHGQMQNTVVTFANASLEKTLYDLLDEGESKTNAPLDQNRVLSPADNILMKDASISTAFKTKNAVNKDVVKTDYAVFDFSKFNFDVRSILLEDNDGNLRTYDLFHDKILSPSSKKAILSSTKTIHLLPPKKNLPILSVYGSSYKAFRVHLKDDERMIDLIPNELILGQYQFQVQIDNQSKELQSFEDLKNVLTEINTATTSEVLIKLITNSGNQNSIHEGFWVYDEQSAVYEYVSNQRLVDYLQDDKDYLVVKDSEMQIHSGDFKKLFLDRNASVMEDQLDYFQYLRDTDSVIPVKKEHISEDYIIPIGYILLQKEKNNNVQFVGQFIQTGTYSYQGPTIDNYLGGNNHLTSAATGRIFVIKSGTYQWLKVDETLIEQGDIVYAERSAVDNFESLRNYEIQEKNIEIQEKNLKAERTRTMISLFGTILSSVTTIILITRN